MACRDSETAENLERGGYISVKPSESMTLKRSSAALVFGACKALFSRLTEIKV